MIRATKFIFQRITTLMITTRAHIGTGNVDALSVPCTVFCGVPPMPIAVRRRLTRNWQLVGCGFSLSRALGIATIPIRRSIPVLVDVRQHRPANRVVEGVEMKTLREGQLETLREGQLETTHAKTLPVNWVVEMITLPVNWLLKTLHRSNTRREQARRFEYALNRMRPVSRPPQSPRVPTSNFNFALPNQGSRNTQRSARPNG